MPTTETRRIGDAEVTVQFEQWDYDPTDFGTRALYRWSITMPSIDGVFTDADIRGPATGHDPGARAMLATLCTFLGAAAEAYSHQMRHPDSTPENLDLFPAPVTEWAYQYADEITTLGFELDEEWA